ncbi:hypothetical protein MSG28_005870 [Choristoneura fumiferana]|uniref:Uncharacterized protein n=1 Tax=Choristoneura fumiferana TaxID=7141 RepID=A0ACC0L0M3_CHOFU|nr:hypothetical protein MSG28_005870 [Choristoneura fumiferana]
MAIAPTLRVAEVVDAVYKPLDVKFPRDSSADWCGAFLYGCISIAMGIKIFIITRYIIEIFHRRGETRRGEPSEPPRGLLYKFQFSSLLVSSRLAGLGADDCAGHRNKSVNTPEDSTYTSVLDILAAASAHRVATTALYVESNTDRNESKHDISAMVLSRESLSDSFK